MSFIKEFFFLGQFLPLICGFFFFPLGKKRKRNYLTADKGKQQNYKFVLPVSCEILADICTPIEALKVLKNVSTHCYLLESAQPSEKWGRYTFLGLDPKMEITCRNGVMKAGELTFETQNPSQTLREILTQYKSPRFAYLPTFTGGLVGYFSYDYLG